MQDNLRAQCENFPPQNRGAHGRHADDHGAASVGPLDCESLDCTFTATSGGVSTGSVVCGDVTSSGTVRSP